MVKNAHRMTAAAALVLAFLPTAAHAEGVGAEVNYGRADGHWGTEIGAGYALDLGGFSLKPGGGVYLRDGDTRLYGRVEATYALPVSATIGAGVRFLPEGDLPLYVMTDVAGTPRAAPPPDDHHVAIRRTFYTLQGKPWEPAPLREGDSLIVGLSLEARSAMPDALLTDLLPGGLEIENFNLTDAKQWADVVVDGIAITDRAQAAEVRHEEFRDDRYVAALKLDQGQAAHVFYLVRAVSPGTYLVPPPLIEDMYLAQARGIGKSEPASIKVVEP